MRKTDVVRSFLATVLILMTGGALAQAPTKQAAGTTADTLRVAQSTLAGRFEQLQRVAAKLAEVTEATEPERAQQLRDVIRRSRELGIDERFARATQLLAAGDLAAASREQAELERELQTLLDQLLADPTASESERRREWLKQQLREVGRLLRQQQSLRSRGTDAKPNPERDQSLAQEQDTLSQAAAKLAQELKGEAESPPPSDSPPSETESMEPTDRAAQRVEAARSAMQRAAEQLQQAQQQGAQSEQQAAEQELQAARKELDRVLRQLREEEVQRTLLQLAARFRAMLTTQRQVHRDTQDISNSGGGAKSRTTMLQAVKLGRQESELAEQSSQALRLLRDDGTSVAIPESVRQLHDDFRSLASKLAVGDVGPVTQSVELDTIASLEDLVGALETAANEAAQRSEQQPPAASQGPGEEDPLVSQLAELRMIRTLQARVQSRTERLAQLSADPQVSQAELEPQIAELAERSRRLVEATLDLASGANR